MQPLAVTQCERRIWTTTRFSKCLLQSSMTEFLRQLPDNQGCFTPEESVLWAASHEADFMQPCGVARG
jgi:hypothetical protein